MDGKKEFVEEFKEFSDELQDAGIDTTVEQAVNLFAIFRKDLRTERINGDEFIKENEIVTESSELATEKQKQFLKKLADERGIDISEIEIDSMSKQEASKQITDLLGGE